jgi:hypothetical protein
VRNSIGAADINEAFARLAPPLGYDYRDPRHVVRYGKLVVRNPDGSTEGKHQRDADDDVMREIHEPAPLLRVIRAKCLDCSAGVESEIRKCTAIGCALWPYRMASNPLRAPREMTPEQREAGAARPAAARARGRSPSETGAPVGQHGNYQGKNIGTTWPVLGTGARRKASRKQPFPVSKRPDWHQNTGEAILRRESAQKPLSHSVPQSEPGNPLRAAEGV